jgi:hypothetical protein
LEWYCGEAIVQSVIIFKKKSECYNYNKPVLTGYCSAAFSLSCTAVHQKIAFDNEAHRGAVIKKERKTLNR